MACSNRYRSWAFFMAPGAGFQAFAKGNFFQFQLKKCVNLVAVKLYLILYMHLARIKKTLTIIVFFVFLFIFWLPAQAQHGSPGMNADGDLLGGSASGSGGGGYLAAEGWAVAVNGGYETPLGKLKETYKAGPVFGLTVINRWNHFILSGTIDYRIYQPKIRTGIYEVEVNGQPVAAGEINFSNFSGLGLYLSASYEVQITPGSSFYAGVNLGSIRSSYSYSYSKSQGVEFDVPEMPSSTVGYVGPKLGLNFALGNKISLGVEARYSFSVSGVSIDSFDGTTSTEGFKSAAGNLFLAYSF